MVRAAAHHHPDPPHRDDVVSLAAVPAGSVWAEPARVAGQSRWPRDNRREHVLLVLVNAPSATAAGTQLPT